MDHQIRRYNAIHVALVGSLPFFVAPAALAACAGAVTPDSPDPISSPDASVDAAADSPADGPADAPSDSPPDAYQGIIGQPCALDADCGDGYRCQTTVPSGYCVANCSSEVPCPSGTVCSPVPYSRISGVCMRTCGSTPECRPEYVCDHVELFPGDPSSPKSPVPVCWEPWPKDGGGGGP